MGVFNLKYRDTRPELIVTLRKPDGTIRSLAGTSGWYLHVKQSDGTYLKRAMVVEGAEANGQLKYTWVSTDWDAGSGGAGTKASPYTVGGLILGPTIPLAPGSAPEHRMEYEVTGSGGARETYPNGDPLGMGDAYDTLRVFDDLGQGA